MGFFYSKQKIHELNIYWGVLSNDNKNDAKFEKELTCKFKIDIGILTYFDRSTQISQKLIF